MGFSPSPLAVNDPNILAEGLGFKAWTFDPIFANFAGTQANTHLGAVSFTAGTKITGIIVGVTVAGTTVTFSRVGIYDINTNLLVSSLDNNAGFQGIGWIQTPFATQFTIPTTGAYYLGCGFLGTVLPTVINFQQTTALSNVYPFAQRGIHAAVPVASLPNPATSVGAFANMPCLIAY